MIVNQCENGYLLRGLPREQTLRAGEVLLLQPPDKPDAARLCSIRWLLLQPSGKEVECGVEILGPRPEPVLTMPSITHSGDHFQRGLHLPGDASSARPGLLLLSGRQFSQLREFRLRDSEGERLVRAARLLLQSPYFQLVEYRPSESF
jgi:hypothetical protein